MPCYCKGHILKKEKIKRVKRDTFSKSCSSHMIELFPQSVSKTVYEQVTIFCLFSTSCWKKITKSFVGVLNCIRGALLWLGIQEALFSSSKTIVQASSKRGAPVHPVQIFPEKWQNSSKVTEMHPFL